MNVKLVAATAAVLVMAAGCGSKDTSSPTPPSTTTATTSAANISSHESVPQSPIAFGVNVPRGAVQLGPLVRQRSQRLISAYVPDLKAAVAEQQAKLEQQESSGTPTPTPSTTTANDKPAKDTFDLLDKPPKPDVFTSYMRITGNPTTVLRRMLAELSALLPDAKISTDDLAPYCSSHAQRVTGCTLNTAGTTPGGQTVRVGLTVDPGDVTTRTGFAASQGDPVMTLTLAYTGDPQTGQQKGFTTKLGDVPAVTGAEKSGLIWPKMDVESPATEALIGSWKAPVNCTLLLTASRPQFAMLYTMKSSDGADAATNYFHTVAPGVHPSKDVISDLNEVITVQRGTRKDGAQVEAIQVIAARGTYVVVSIVPRS